MQQAAPGQEKEDNSDTEALLFLEVAMEVVEAGMDGLEGEAEVLAVVGVLAVVVAPDTFAALFFRSQAASVPQMSKAAVGRCGSQSLNKAVPQALEVRASV
jgi:hypothetical protein